MDEPDPWLIIPWALVVACVIIAIFMAAGVAGAF